jgi:Phenylacetic acid catabolic protein
MTVDIPFRDKVEAHEATKMPAEYQALLKRVLRIQADCEIGGPHLYVNQWLLTAPSADDQWMLAKVASEEIDHFRKINRLLNELGDDASELMYVEKSRRDLEAFRQAMPTWADVAAFGFLIDRVGQYQLEEFVGCSYAPLDRTLPRIIQEEKAHVGYGYVKLRDLGDRGRARPGTGRARPVVSARARHVRARELPAGGPLPPLGTEAPVERDRAGGVHGRGGPAHRGSRPDHPGRDGRPPLPLSAGRRESRRTQGAA